MSYLKINYMGEMHVVHSTELIKDLVDQKGVTLVITESSRWTNILGEQLAQTIPESVYRRSNGEVSKDGSFWIFNSATSYMNYMGMQLSGVYLWRDLSIDLAFKLMCRVR